MRNRERYSSMISSVRVGRCAISTGCTSIAWAGRYIPTTGVVRLQGARGGPPIGFEPLLGVELDDQLLLNLRVNDSTLGKRVHEDPHLRRDDLDPGRDGTLAGLGPGHHERGELQAVLAHLDDVTRRHAHGGDVRLVAVQHDVAVADQLARVVAGLGEAGPVDHVVQTGLEDAEQVLTRLATLAVGLLVVTAELLLQNAVDTGGLLLLAKLEQVLVLLGATAAVLARGVRADLDRALRAIALAALEEELRLLAAAALAVGAGVTGHGSSTLLAQTRRRFGGRQPLCGEGVTSLMDPTSRPVCCSDRMAVSRPEPGPLTNTSTFFMPCSMA